MQNNEIKAADFDTIHEIKDRKVKKTSKKWKILSFSNKNCPSMSTMKSICLSMGDDQFLNTFKGMYETITNSFDDEGKRYEIRTANVTLCVNEDELAEYQGLLHNEGYIPEKVSDAFDKNKFNKKNK